MNTKTILNLDSILRKIEDKIKAVCCRIDGLTSSSIETVGGVPTIQAESAMGTTPTATVVSAQSSNKAGRILLVSGTGPSTGLWATITFASEPEYTITPIVQLGYEDEAAAEGDWHVNVSTSGFEIFRDDTPDQLTTHSLTYTVTRGKEVDY